MRHYAAVNWYPISRSLRPQGRCSGYCRLNANRRATLRQLGDLGSLVSQIAQSALSVTGIDYQNPLGAS
jgi:hypothetical protein